MNKKGKSGNRGPAEKPKIDWKALDVVHANAAGIDIGGSEHWLAINPERDPEPVRCRLLYSGCGTDGGLAGGARSTQRGYAIDRGVLCAEQRIDREGSSPSGAQMRGAVSKSGDNTSLAGESGRYGEA